MPKLTRITQAQLIRLVDWFRANKKVLAELNLDQIRGKIANEVGLTVGDSQIRNIAGMAGVNYKNRPRVNQHVGTAMRLRNLEVIVLRIIESMKKEGFDTTGILTENGEDHNEKP